MVLIFVVFGYCLVKSKINFIYGGGFVGFMGIVVKIVVEGGCEVIGFFFEFFV